MKLIYYLIRFFNPLSLIIFLISSEVTAQNPVQSIIDASDITSWVREDGYHDFEIINEEFNGSYPNGLPVGVIHTEGICWGGLVFDDHSQIVRVNGNNFGSGCYPITRLYRVRTDYYKTDLINDAANFFMKDRKDITDEELEMIRNQYEKDWDEWPAYRGAPYYDVDKDGKYDPDIDVPGVPGALQTLWINYNDDGGQLYGSEVIGLDIRETYWVYGTEGRISNIIYKKVDIIYRGTSSAPPGSRIDSMYICEWGNTHVGYSGDDYIGTDTILNLGYTYNSVDPDPEYIKYGLAPPAVGYSILQGVSEYTGSSTDSAVFNFRWVKGRRYFNQKPLTNSILHRIGGCFGDPDYTYNGALEYYNLMSGYEPYPWYPARQTGCDFTGYGTYMLPGDPVTGTGDIDGVRDAPGYRRMWLMNGPFTMKLGDTAEVVIALIAGMGEDHLASITNLRNITEGAILFYNSLVEEMTNGSLEIPPPERSKSYLIPADYVLNQNYPNPFNSLTTIRYQLPEPAFVRLIVYDVLGREVARLVNKEKPAGTYSVQFNADNLSSGVYFYKISFDNASGRLVFDGLNKTMKLILIK